MDHKEFKEYKKCITRLFQQFPEGLTLIGGAAISLKEMSNGGRFVMPLDVSCVITENEFAELREEQSLIRNSKLCRHEFITNGFCFNVYCDNYSKIKVPVREIISFSENVVFPGESVVIKVADNGNVLKLKSAVAQRRKNNNRGEKDKDDLIRLLLVMKKENIPENIVRLDDDDLEMIKEAINGESTVRLSGGNLHSARKLKEDVKQVYQNIENKIKNDIDAPDGGQP